MEERSVRPASSAVGIGVKVPVTVRTTDVVHVPVGDAISCVVQVTPVGVGDVVVV